MNHLQVHLWKKPVERLNNAAVFGETDYMKSISARIMAGMPIQGGTGLCNLILWYKMIEQSEYVSDTIEDPVIAESSVIIKYTSKRKIYLYHYNKL